MKNLLITIAILASSSAFAGTQMIGDKVHFQAASTWVNSYYSKSLCFDGANFHAEVTKCAEYREDSKGERECVATMKVAAVQPQVSTREICAEYREDNTGNNECVSWKSVPYVQSEVKTVKFYKEQNDEGDLASLPFKTVTYTVPACN
jgi:hypothetical protein